MNPHADEHFPVSVVLSRQWRQHGQWRFPHWELVSIVPAEQIRADASDAPTVRRVDAQEGVEHYIWSGLSLELFRDGLQAYYQNLTAQEPTLLVLCRDDDEDTGVAPVAVSANFADGEAHMETDGLVLSTPLQPPFSQWLADYILQHQDYLNRHLQDHKKGNKGKKRHV